MSLNEFVGDVAFCTVHVSALQRFQKRAPSMPMAATFLGRVPRRAYFDLTRLWARTGAAVVLHPGEPRGDGLNHQPETITAHRPA